MRAVTVREYGQPVGIHRQALLASFPGPSYLHRSLVIQPALRRSLH